MCGGGALALAGCDVVSVSMYPGVFASEISVNEKMDGEMKA